MTEFVSLHAHTTYSFLDGYGTPEQVADRLEELGQGACAVTDHGNVFAHVPMQRVFRQRGLKLVLGCEFYVVDDASLRERHVRSLGADVWPHVTVLAATQRGYANLLKLSRLSYEEGFYYKARTDWRTIARYQEGLVVLSGCVGGFPSRLALTKGPEAAYDFVRQRLKEVERYYVELIPEPGLDESHQTLPTLLAIARDLGVPAVLTPDAHFPRREDHAVQDLALCVGLRKKLDDPTRTLRLPEYQYYCSALELYDRALQACPTARREDLQQALENAGRVAALCEAEVPKASGVFFPDVKSDAEAELLLWDLVAQGLRERPIPPELWQDYHARAGREYDVLRRKGFCHYLLTVTDVVRHARSLGSLTLCRGSAGGCLLLWLLGVSETDPILHRLSFERFYDETRSDPPDVDVDFERGYREAAIEYVYSRYGRQNCSRLAALSQVRAKQALQDAAFALDVPRADYAALSSTLDARDDLDAGGAAWDSEPGRRLRERYPLLLSYAQRLVGQYRQQSINAAGVLVSPTPLDEVVGVVLGQDKKPVAAVDKYGAAELGFLKFDMLAVNTLDVLAAAVRKLQRPVDWLYSLPLDDEATYRTASAGLLAGVFQLDGASAARVSRQIGLDTFEDLYAASALCRPGPADWVAVYERHKRSPQAFEAYLAQWHPVAADVVRPTYGVLLYQEQVMRLARELAGFEWADVHKLRKGIVASAGGEFFERYHALFTRGCAASGCSEAEAEHWWQTVVTHGGYSFNAAHTVTYGLVSYWTLYLKTHHPGAFYEAYLAAEDDELTVKRLLREFRALGGEVVVLHPAYSGATFSLPRPHLLVGGLQNLKGVGPATAAKVLAQGPFHDWPTFLDALPAALRQRVVEAGVPYGPDHADPQLVLQLAPWAPVTRTNAEEAALRDQRRLARPGDLSVGWQLSDDVYVAGYVTATHLDNEKVRLQLEDESGSVHCRVPQRLVAQVAPRFRELQVSDYVAVLGWWSGEVLYAKDCALVRRRERVPAAPKRAARRSKVTTSNAEEVTT